MFWTVMELSPHLLRQSCSTSATFWTTVMQQSPAFRENVVTLAHPGMVICLLRQRFGHLQAAFSIGRVCHLMLPRDRRPGVKAPLPVAIAACWLPPYIFLLSGGRDPSTTSPGHLQLHRFCARSTQHGTRASSRQLPPTFSGAQTQHLQAHHPSICLY